MRTSLATQFVGFGLLSVLTPLLALDPRVSSKPAAPVTPRFAYVPNRSSNTVSAFAVDSSTGALSVVPGSPFPTASGPISAATDPKGHFLYVADLGSFQISAYRINQNNGALSEISGSPFDAGQNPEFIAIHPSGHYLYVLDTFFSPDENGEIEVFSMDSSTGAITQIPGSPFPAGIVPGSIAFARNGKLAYVTDIASNQVLGYSLDTNSGALLPLPGSPYAAGSFPVSVAVDNVSGSVYVANEGNNVSAYFINQGGDLKPIPGSPFSSRGSIPLSVAVDERLLHLYVLNDVSANLREFQINSHNGVLHRLAGSFATGSAPTCAVVDPSAKFLFAVNSGSDNVSVYAIDQISGQLTEISGSPFPAGREPSSIAITRAPGN